MTFDIKKLLAEASLPERAVSICFAGKLVAEFQRLEDRLEAAQQKRLQDKRLANSPETQDIAQEIESVREQMREATGEFTLRAFPGRKWRDMKAAHPLPEEPTPVDRVLGADSGPLFNTAVREAIVDPELDDEAWEQLTETIADSEWQKLVDATYSLNEEVTSIPFSQRGSAILRASAEDSNSQETGE